MFYFLFFLAFWEFSTLRFDHISPPSPSSSRSTLLHLPSHPTSSYQPPIVPLLEVEMCAHVPLHDGIWSCLGMWRSWACCHSFMCALPCCAEHTVPYSHPPLWLLHSFHALFCNGPWVSGWGCVTSILGRTFQSLLFSLSRPIVGSVFIIIYCTQSFSDKGFETF